MQFRIRVSATVVTVSSEDYGRFVLMHFRSRERNDHTVNVRSRERTCGRFVPGTKLPYIWNSLRNSVVYACTVNAFKARLDKFWKHQSVKFDFTADLTGTGNRSEEVIK